MTHQHSFNIISATRCFPQEQCAELATRGWISHYGPQGHFGEDVNNQLEPLLLIFNPDESEEVTFAANGPEYGGRLTYLYVYPVWWTQAQQLRPENCPNCEQDVLRWLDHTRKHGIDVVGAFSVGNDYNDVVNDARFKLKMLCNSSHRPITGNPGSGV